MRYQVTEEWILDVPDGFQHRVEGNHLVLWKRGSTIVLTAYSYTSEKNQATLLANLRGKAEAQRLKIIEDVKDGLKLFGFIQAEEIQPGHNRLVLHTFSTSPQGCLQTAYYLDETEELETALRSWQSVTYHPRNEEQYE